MKKGDHEMSRILKMIGILNTGLVMLIFILNFGKPIHLYLIGVSEHADIQNSAFVFLIYALLMGLAILLQKISKENGNNSGEIQVFQYRFLLPVGTEKSDLFVKRTISHFFSVLALIVQCILLFQLICILFQTRLFGSWFGYVIISFVVIDFIYLFLSLYNNRK